MVTKPETTPVARRKDGRWKKGVSGNPKGKPLQNASRKLLQANAEALTQKAIDLALAGDVTAMNACLARILPALKPQQPEIMLSVKPTDDIVQQAEQVIAAMTSGQIPPDIGQALIQTLETVSKIRETAELEARLSELEKQVEKWDEK